MINCIFFNRRCCRATAYFFAANVMQIRAILSSVTLAVVIIVVAVPRPANDDRAVSGLNMKNPKDNILIRKIDGAETAGVSYPVFDKTSTITKGALRVVSFTSPETITGRRIYAGSAPEMLLINICSNANAIALVQTDISGDRW
ncbi:MAG: hypothetical protein ACLVJ6_07135 [Merdibacter sp.]